MDIEVRKNGRKWIAEVWGNPIKKMSDVDRTVPFLEEQYIEINQWCIDTFGYHARTACLVFESRKQSHLD
jgi:hypothetical protein